MKVKIRTKLFIAFAIMLLPIIIPTIIDHYNRHIIYKVMNKLGALVNEKQMISNLSLAMDRILMPGNDYIITGNRKYFDDFRRQSAEMENCMRAMEGTETHGIATTGVETHSNASLQDLEHSTKGDNVPHAAGVSIDNPEERETLEFIETAWRHIREISLKIFAISNPMRNRRAARLMEEMDYQWSYPAIERLQKWREMLMEKHRITTESLEKMRRRSGIIMDTGHSVAMVLCISFAFLFSSLLVRTIKKLQKGAEIIAGGNLDYRIDIHSGDELGQLAEKFNSMGEKLKVYYAVLEDKVKERTRELQERVDELERFGKATIQREFRMKELKEEIQNLKLKIEELEKG